MSVTIEQIEDAVVDAINPLKGTLGVRTVKTYQGELDADDLKQITARLPAIFVMYGGSGYTPHGGRKTERPRMVVFVVDRSLRAEEDARRGGTTNPGTYAMLSGVRTVLCGQQLSLAIHPLELLREDPVWFGDGVSIYTAEYETGQSHLFPAA